MVSSVRYSGDTLTAAFLSMEIGIDAAMPTYAGGLGVLAGDVIRAAADIELPMAGVSLLHRKGYFRQHLDSFGNQTEGPAEWSPEQLLELLPVRVMITLANQQIQVQAWRYLVRSESGFTVPVYFLDTNLAENPPWVRSLTDYLYGADAHYRLCQEVVLGFGGLTLLRAIGHKKVRAFHMNEGHSAFTSLALLEERLWGRGLSTATAADKEAVRQHCVFTTHTPLLAGHDGFPLHLVREVLGEERTNFLLTTQCCTDGGLSMTRLALDFSRYVNGVSMRHEEVSQTLFVNHRINAVTNGVHATTWTSPSFKQIYDRYIPEWRRDNLYLRYAIRIPVAEIWHAHQEAKKELLQLVERRTGRRLDPGLLTIGFARRAAAYKRSDLLFRDVNRLREVVKKAGGIQIIYGGKAHPTDEPGKDLIRRVFQAAAELGNDIPVVYLEEYDLSLAKYLCAGVDLWLNTPQKPHEASGTSGMKAALNGVPSLSVLDGWWIEGHIEAVTGWAVGDGWRTETDLQTEVTSLYDKLEFEILPLYYRNPDDFAGIMRSAIAMNGSYFNAQRMIVQYLQNAYIPAGSPHPAYPG